MVPENVLLALLDPDARAAVPLEPVRLKARDVLYESGMPALYAYFPCGAVISVVSTMESGATSEVALVGLEGMVGHDSLLGTVEGLTAAVVQVPGLALRTPIAALKAARASSATVRKMLDLYLEARFIQVAQISACNRLHSLEERLARWLLAVHDRIQSDTFTLPQESIGQMLGAQRPTVSIALGRLQDRGVIEYRGRAIVIRDRVGLEGLACECHRVLRREFDRLLRHGLRGVDLVSPEMHSPSAVGRDAAAAVEATREIAGRLLLATLREQEAREEAEAATRAKDQFLAALSHELRTPLNAILGWCTTLARHDDQAYRQGLAAINANASAQLKLVDKLLDAACITSATLTMQPMLVDLADLIKQAMDRVKPTADEKHVALGLTKGEHLGPIPGDPARLQQVLVNVMANAVKFTDAGGSIVVSIAAAAGTVRIAVRDTGRGIAPDVLPHVFERFRQGSQTSNHANGLGLGLTIARAIMRLHGGAIEITSAGEGQGTTCTISLPLAAA